MRCELTDAEAFDLSGGAPFPAELAALSGAVERATAWSRWDWLAWAAPWAVASFLVAGPLVFVALILFVP